MTRLQILALIFFLGLLLLGGAVAVNTFLKHITKSINKNATTESVVQKTKSRIVFKCKQEDNTGHIYIYEIDSVEYIISEHGGIYPLIKKTK